MAGEKLVTSIIEEFISVENNGNEEHVSLPQGVRATYQEFLDAAKSKVKNPFLARILIEEGDKDNPRSHMLAHEDVTFPYLLGHTDKGILLLAPTQEIMLGLALKVMEPDPEGNATTYVAGPLRKFTLTFTEAPRKNRVFGKR